MMIKEVLQGIAVIGALIGLAGCEGYIQSSYTREAMVTSCYEDCVTVEDTTGNEWQFIGKEYKTGDKVKLYMDNNHTDNNIYDDRIVKVKATKEKD